jgi:BON domain
MELFLLAERPMVMRTTRWIVAAILAFTVASGGCARSHADTPVGHARTPVNSDPSLVHAFDTQMEMRVLDRLELDNFLRDRDIRLQVDDGNVSITGEVWTSLEKERVSELIRSVPGVIDVSNDLVVRPPR